MFLLTTLLNKVRERFNPGPSIKIRGTDGKITRINVPPSTSEKGMLDCVRRHARIINENHCGSKIWQRPHSSVVVLDDNHFVTIWYGGWENERN